MRSRTGYLRGLGPCWLQYELKAGSDRVLEMSRTMLAAVGTKMRSWTWYLRGLGPCWLQWALKTKSGLGPGT